jgi:hypothetical protein
MFSLSTKPATIERSTELTANPPRRSGEIAHRSFSAFADAHQTASSGLLEDDLDPRATATDPDAAISPDSGKTDDQRRGMGVQGSAARLCHEEHQRDQGGQ